MSSGWHSNLLEVDEDEQRHGTGQKGQSKTNVIHQPGRVVVDRERILKNNKKQRSTEQFLRADWVPKEVTSKWRKQ